MLKTVPGYGYDDLLLEPRKSRLDSRTDPDISTNVGVPLDIPIISSPMDTVTEWRMAQFMDAHGALGIIHRYMPIGQQMGQVYSLKLEKPDILVGASIGANGDAIDRAYSLIDMGVAMIVFDVAHGHSLPVLRAIEAVRKRDDGVLIMSGNVATREAMRDSLEAGAQVLRVGIGAGSACTTRLECGVGVPQLTAIDRARDIMVNERYAGWIVADGGIKHTGDMVKAIAAGADAVMLGGLLSRFSVAPKPGEFRGMASRAALMEFKGKAPVAEGESFEAPLVADDEVEFDSMCSTLRQGFAYLGAASARDLRDNALWIEVSPLAYAEGQAHFGRRD